MPPESLFLLFASMLFAGPYNAGIVLSSSSGVTETCQSEHNVELNDKTTDSWMFREIVLRNSSARLACAVYCSQDPSCITFMVNRNSRICRFYGARITRYNTLTDDVGFVSYDTCRAQDAYGTICTADSDCLLANTVCINNVCQCNYGWSYSPNDSGCIRKCAEYGPEFTVFKHYYITLNNIETLSDPEYLTLEGCAAACVSATTFVCRTFELDFKENECLLQEITEFDNPSGFYYVNSRDVYHGQRQCRYVE